MRIGIDISQVVYEGTGVSRFTKGLIDTILTHETQNEWVFFLSALRRQPDLRLIKDIKANGYRFARSYLPPFFLAILWNDLHQYNVENMTGKLDWFISSDWTEPPAKAKKATIVHDLTFKRYPETVDPTIQLVQEKRLSWIEKESSIIFVDSNSTKDDLITIMGYDENKIVVNYPGVTTQKQPPEKIEATLKKFHLKKPFILTVGKIEPRKNIKKLIEAYTHIETDVELAIVGQSGWDTETKQMYGDNKKIHWLGYISDEELYALYQSSLFFIFPSIWEGFGYPAVEAMQLGCPCALSNSSSLGEIGRDAALLFDPWQTDSIKHAIETMLNDVDLRNRLIQKGLEKSASFTWKRYFDTMINTLTKI